jgi:hypothetical protein
VLLAWLAYPLLLLVLCAGLGLLLDALCGKRLPGALIAPAGFVAFVVLAQVASLLGAGIGAIATGTILLAGIGVAAAMPWRFGRPDPWAALASLAAFLLFAAPVLLSGHPTFAVYGTEGDIAGWLAIGSSDPVGAILPLAAAQRPLGGELAWHLQPYLATLAALLSLSAWQLATGAPARFRASIAFLATVPALIFGYAGWGGVQELAALVSLALAAALAPAWREGVAAWRARVPLAIALLAALCLLIPFSPLDLDAGVWLATAALAALTAATVALSLRVAAAQPRAAFALFSAALLACAVVASAGAALAPYGRLSELGEVNASFAGQGPALALGRNPYADYFLRDLVDPVSLDDPKGKAIPSSPTAKGPRFEADQLDYKALLDYSLLVIPRSPAQSRPPLPYKRRYLGADYEAWVLPRTASFRLLFHMPVGEPGAPYAQPDCSQVNGLGLLGLANQLGAAPQDISIVAAAPRRGSRLGPTVAVPVDRTRSLCGRRWDWIEAIAPTG